MTTVLFMKDAHLSLKIGAGSAVKYQGQVASAAVEVEPGSAVTYPTLDGANQSQVGPSAYSLALRAGQVWDTTAAAGLAAFLWANEGAIADFVIQAHGALIAPSTTQPAVSGQVRLVAGNYGGEVAQYAEIEVSLPCIAKPTLMTTGALPTSADDPEAMAAEGATEAEA